MDIVTEAERTAILELDDSRPPTSANYSTFRPPDIPSSAPPLSRHYPAMRVDIGGVTPSVPSQHRSLPPNRIRQQRHTVKPRPESELMITPHVPTPAVEEPQVLTLRDHVHRMLSRITDDSENSSLDVEPDPPSLLHVVSLNDNAPEASPHRVGFKPRKLSLKSDPPPFISGYRRSHYEPLDINNEEIVKYRYLSGYTASEDCSYMGVSGAMWDRIIGVDPGFIKRLLVKQVEQATAAASVFEEDSVVEIPCEAPQDPLPTLFEEDSTDVEAEVPRTQCMNRDQSSRSGMLSDMLRAPSPQRLKPELVTRNIIYNTLPKKSK